MRAIKVLARVWLWSLLLAFVGWTGYMLATNWAFRLSFGMIAATFITGVSAFALLSAKPTEWDMYYPYSPPPVKPRVPE